MRIIHCADCHLGFNRFGGFQRKWREQDFFDAFSFVVECAESADVLIIAGDLFDSPRPQMHVLKFVQTKFLELFESNTLVLIVGGNHDTPKAQGTHPCELLSWLPNVEVCTQEPRLIEFGSFKFGLIPWIHGKPVEEIPDCQILVVHAAREGEPLLQAEVRKLRDVNCWYVAAGHLHDFYVRGNFHNPGAIERLNFGEKDAKCGIFEIDGFEVTWKPTPARAMKVVNSLDEVNNRDLVKVVSDEVVDCDLENVVIERKSFGRQLEVGPLIGWDEYCMEKNIREEVKQLGLRFLDEAISESSRSFR